MDHTYCPHAFPPNSQRSTGLNANNISFKSKLTIIEQLTNQLSILLPNYYPILSEINPVHTPPSHRHHHQHSTSWRYILIIPSHLRLGLPSKANHDYYLEYILYGVCTKCRQVPGFLKIMIHIKKTRVLVCIWQNIKYHTKCISNNILCINYTYTLYNVPTGSISRNKIVITVHLSLM